MSEKPEAEDPLEDRGADVTGILNRAAHDVDSPEVQALMPVVYQELVRLARARMGGRGGAALEPGDLVSEAWGKLYAKDPKWNNRQHFWRAASLAMRHIVIDHWRKRSNLDKAMQEYTQIASELDISDPGVATLHQALENLAKYDSTMAEIVNLRFFGGLTMAETADVLNLSHRSTERRWARARVWLSGEVKRLASD